MLVSGVEAAAPAVHATASNDTIAQSLGRDVAVLASDIGARAVSRPGTLNRAAEYLNARLSSIGSVRRLPYVVDGGTVENLELEFPGTSRASEIVVVGAHYDTIPTTPGADDNATGVAALLHLATEYAQRGPQPRTVRFVAFANEEPPYFQTNAMGSVVYAKSCRARGDNIVAMISLESIGFYSDAKGTQRYPSALLRLFFPSRGNFLAIVGNKPSKPLVREIDRAFKSRVRMPTKAVALSETIQGVGWSDHWAFWQSGYPAVMVTDTAPMRNPHYHRETDTPDNLDFPRFAQAVKGLGAVVYALAAGSR